MIKDKKKETLHISKKYSIQRMKDYCKKNTWYFLFFLFLFHLLHSGIVFSEGMWFDTKLPHRINDGSVYQSLYLSSTPSLSGRVAEEVMVFGQEKPLKWNKGYHKGTFNIKSSFDEQRQPVYVLNSLHSSRYEVKATATFLTEKDTMTVLGAKISLFLYGMRDFIPQDRDHEWIRNQDVAFPLELTDKNASSNYWLQTGQKCRMQALFFGKPLAGKTVRLFIKGRLSGEFKTDSQGCFVVTLPYPEDAIFSHTKDVCHYHLQIEHEYENTQYISTLTLLVHPARKGKNRFNVGFYTVAGTVGISTAFVLLKRLKKHENSYS